MGDIGRRLSTSIAANLTSATRALAAVVVALLVVSCANTTPIPFGPSRDPEPDVVDTGGRGGEDAVPVRDTGGGGEDTGPVRDTGPSDTSGTPDTVAPDTGTPDTVTPDTGTPDTVTPDTGGPDGGECRGVGCACSPITAETICGASPCVDGFCCDSACAGACESCGIAGSEGSCTFYEAETDPESECPVDARTTCGRNGSCDGAGACAFYGSETTCDDREACSNNDTCDGTGSCRGEVPAACGPGPGNECCAGTCADGVGCATTPTTCDDVCGATELSVDDVCLGCGAAGAIGSCAGGSTYRCDETQHSPCQEVTCGGTRYWCTNTGGTWGWKPTGLCDDGNACTYGDTCSVGTCTGTPVSCVSDECADRTCNGTALCDVKPNTGDSCDDGDPCTYGNTCNAAGVCSAGSRVTCESTDCVSRTCNNTASCVETVRTGATCDDGNLCTYNDRCGADGSCVAAGSVDCSGVEETCRDFVCNGTASCVPEPYNVGGACNDGNPDTDFDVCRADGTCAGDEGCPPPSTACVDGTQSRDRCSGARTINRLTAGMGGWGIIDDTCDARDRSDDSGSCYDAGGDHHYRLYMREGEVAQFRYTTGEGCYDPSWSGTLKIYESSGCDATDCGSRAYCNDYHRSGDNPVNYTAVRDGWVIVVADGSTAFDDEGAYQLTVGLACRGGDCSCR